MAVDVSLFVEPEGKKSSGVLGMMIGAVVLAGAMGGGGVWYGQHHDGANVAVTLAAQAAPPAAKEAPPPAAEAKTEEAPVIELTDEKVKKTDKAEAKATKRANNAKATQSVAKAEAPKPAPPPKLVNGGAVDAVLQQQLKGAL